MLNAVTSKVVTSFNSTGYGVRKLDAVTEVTKTGSHYAKTSSNLAFNLLSILVGKYKLYQL